MRPGERPAAWVRRAWKAGDDRFERHRYETIDNAFGMCNRCGHVAGDPPQPCFRERGSLARSRERLHLPACEDCTPERLIAEPGDVAMCVRCGQWWVGKRARPSASAPPAWLRVVDSTLVHLAGPASIAARYARAPMATDEVIAALDAAGKEMVLL